MVLLKAAIERRAMSEFAVERARQMFQARQSGRRRQQAQRARLDGDGASVRRHGPETTADPAASEESVTPVELIGALHIMHARLRRLDGWLRDEHQLNLTEMHVLSRLPANLPAHRGSDGDYR